MIELHEDFLSKTKSYDSYSEDLNTTSKEINVKRQAVEAFVETVKMFEDQIKLQEKFQKDAQPHEVKRYNLLYYFELACWLFMISKEIL